MGLEIYLRCLVSQGVFESERIFTLETSGKVYSAIVDKSDVVYKGELKSGQGIEGKVRVYVVKEEKDKILVQFPRDTINGWRAWIPKELFVY